MALLDIDRTVEATTLDLSLRTVLATHTNVHHRNASLGTSSRLTSVSEDPAWLQPFDYLVLFLHFTSGDPKNTLGHECVKAEQRYHSSSRRKPWPLPTGRRIK